VWSDHPHEGLRTCMAGLAVKPSAHLLWRKAKLLRSLGDNAGAELAPMAS